MAPRQVTVSRPAAHEIARESTGQARRGSPRRAAGAMSLRDFNFDATGLGLAAGAAILFAVTF